MQGNTVNINQPYNTNKIECFSLKSGHTMWVGRILPLKYWSVLIELNLYALPYDESLLT